jgi:methylmalonyl-CoA/ethylmalonyl-CoA epimerase
MNDEYTPITQIDHVGVPVWNADEAMSFFEHVNVPVAINDQLPEYNIRAVFLDFDGIYLELLEPTGPGNVKTFLERHGPGYQHVAYRVPDIDRTVDRLRADGMTFQSPEPQDGAGDSRIIFLEERHTGGLQTELVERR